MNDESSRKPCPPDNGGATSASDRTAEADHTPQAAAMPDVSKLRNPGNDGDTGSHRAAEVTADPAESTSIGSPGSRGVRSSRADRSSKSAPGTAGIVGTILAFAALLVAIFAWLKPQAAAPTDARVESIGLEVSRLQNVRFSPTEAVGGDTPESTGYNVQDSVIDVRLSNTGGSPILITAINAEFLYSKLLIACPGIGGELTAAGQYDIKVPTTAKAPFSLRAAKPFQVAPNSFDRLAVTIGPLDSHAPWVYTVKLTAETSDPGRQIDLGTATIANPSSGLGKIRAQPFSSDPADEQCIRENRETLADALSYGAKVSPDLEELHDRFARAVAAMDVGASPPQEGSLSDKNWAGVSLDYCDKAGMSTRLKREDYGDLTRDGLPEAIITQACVAGSTAHSPDVIRVFDGRGSARNPMLIETILGPADGFDARGLQVEDATLVNGKLSITSTAYRPADPDGEPSVYVIDQFVWDDRNLVRAGARECFDSVGTVRCVN